MKLTNISLAILVALGLAACGGSDDNTPQTSDNQEAGHNNQTPTGGDETSTPPKDKSGLDPERVAPDLTVPKDLQTDVNVSKATYLSRGFANNALGYPVNDRSYDADKGTKPADVKFASLYNYADENDVIDANTVPFTDDAVGAIDVGKDPGDGREINAFVKIGSKYYRVKANIGPKEPRDYKASTKFILVPPVKKGTGNKTIVDKSAADELQKATGYVVKGASKVEGKYVDQSQVVFIANAKPTTWPADNSDQTLYDASNAALVVDLGKESNFNAKTNQTVLTKISTLGVDYIPSVTGQTLDFSKLDVNKDKIQFVDVDGKFTISNDKNDADNNNDFSVSRDIELGKVKAYNLPYSIAYVTVDPSKENEKNIFNLVSGKAGGDLTNGSYQVRGYQTLSLPKQGRAHYTGKSFNERVEGDIKLTADFFEDRAGVHGIVTNRKDVVKGKELSNLKLSRLTLTDPEHHGTFARTDLAGKSPEGRVYGDPTIDSWSVQFYGLEAQEAGGKLYHSKTDYEEVYTTQRGRLTNLSNTSDVK